MALIGNSILIARHSRLQVLAQFLLKHKHLRDARSVIFVTGGADVGKLNTLAVSRSPSWHCVRIKRFICQAFAAVNVLEELANALLLADGAPPCVAEAAVELAEA